MIQDLRSNKLRDKSNDTDEKVKKEEGGVGDGRKRGGEQVDLL